MSDDKKNEPVFVTRPFLPDKAVFMRYVDEIWRSYHLTNHGPLHDEFAARLSAMFGGAHVTLAANGHLALELAIKGMELSGEVITTPFTFASTTHALASNGIAPVFCDINSGDLTLDADLIEELITDKTTAIMPVHVYGHLCDGEKIGGVAAKYGLKVIYDAAHAFGIEKNGRSVAQYGDVSMLSFHATKLFHSIEGGALIYNGTDSPDLKRIFGAYQNFGIAGGENTEYIGGNAKMNEFQAAMGLSVLPHVREIIAERRLITMRYRENLRNLEGIRCFVPDDDDSVSHNYAYMPITVDDELCGVTRDCLCGGLKKHGVYARKYFYPLTSDFACYRAQSGKAELPVARKAAAQVLCLPIYNGLPLATVDRICAIIRETVE